MKINVKPNTKTGIASKKGADLHVLKAVAEHCGYRLVAMTADERAHAQARMYEVPVVTAIDLGTSKEQLAVIIFTDSSVGGSGFFGD